MGGPSTPESIGSAEWPGARHSYASAVANESLWIFGRIMAHTNAPRTLLRLVAKKYFFLLFSYQHNFYLVGDLWMFNSSANAWVLLYNTSSPTADYTSATSPTPGMRSNATMWVDDNGENIWLFGGLPNYDDLWKFTVASGWVYINGGDSLKSAYYPPGYPSMCSFFSG